MTTPADGNISVAFGLPVTPSKYDPVNRARWDLIKRLSPEAAAQGRQQAITEQWPRRDCQECGIEMYVPTPAEDLEKYKPTLLCAVCILSHVAEGYKIQQAEGDLGESMPEMPPLEP